MTNEEALEWFREDLKRYRYRLKKRREPWGHGGGTKYHRPDCGVYQSDRSTQIFK